MRWRNCGKPHHGLEYDDMNFSRAILKLKFRDCLRNEESMKADAIALKLRNKDRANSGEKSMRSIIRKLVLSMVVLALLILLKCGENILWAYLIQSTTPHPENM